MYLRKAVRVNGAPASERTQEFTQKVIYASMRTLHRLGYKLERIENLSDKHIEALVRYWHDNNYAPKTIQNNFSRINVFCGWMGRSNLIRRGGAAAYLPDVPKEELRVKTCTDKSKSWTANGVNVEQMLETSKLEDERWYSMLLLELFFGLRVKEALGIKPWEADKGRYLNIDNNHGKGGRPRVILIEDTPLGEFQRLVLDYVKRQCGKKESLCWPSRSMKQGRDHYYYLMGKHGLTKAKLGVTGHGLRAESAENEALRKGLLPPSLGGTRNQLPKEQMQEIALGVSNYLGHNDLHTVGAYYGSFRKAAPKAWSRIGGFVLDETRIASVYTDPPLIQEPNGSYKQKTAEQRAWISVCVRIEEGSEPERALDLKTFVREWPAKEQQLLGLLKSRGLGEALAE